MLAEINEVNYTKMFIVSKYESSGPVNFIEKKPIGHLVKGKRKNSTNGHKGNA